MLPRPRTFPSVRSPGPFRLRAKRYGETSTKLLNLSGTTGAGFLYANQAGTAPTALILANGIAATGGGIKNFYLGGNASASVVNELRGVLQDNTTTNKTSLVKMGASTWLYVPAAASFVSTAPTGITVASGGAANTSRMGMNRRSGMQGTASSC